MKKNLLVLMLAFATSSAFAQATVTNNPCTGASVAGTGAEAVTGADGTFVVTSFTPNCSANVFLSTEQDRANFGVCAGSAKGKTMFSGGSNGGSVGKSSVGGDCGPSGCEQPDAACTTAAMTKGLSS